MSQNSSTESANEEKHHSILAHLSDHTQSDISNDAKIGEVFQQQVRSININEAGFQAVHSSMFAASSSNSEEHKKTHAILSQCQGLIQEIIRNHITIESVDRSANSPPTRPNAVGDTTTTSMVFWKYRRLRLPIGMLDIKLSQTRQTKRSRRSDPQVSAKSKIKVVFVPPRWLSSVVITYSMKLRYDLTSSRWHWGATLAPLTINENPFFINAIVTFNVEDLRTSFLRGLAKPTDHVLDHGLPIFWYQVRLKSAFNSDMLNSSRSSSFGVTGIPALTWNYLSISW